MEERLKFNNLEDWEDALNDVGVRAELKTYFKFLLCDINNDLLTVKTFINDRYEIIHPSAYKTYTHLTKFVAHYMECEIRNIYRDVGISVAASA